MKDVIAQVAKARTGESTIVYRDINIDATTKFLMDDRLAFMQTCLEIVCYDELSSFINFGDETSYMIRVFVGGDPFGNSVDADAETGLFEPDPSGDELMGGVFLTKETDGDTNIEEIEYNAD